MKHNNFFALTVDHQDIIGVEEELHRPRNHAVGRACGQQQPAKHDVVCSKISARSESWPNGTYHA